MSNDFCFETRLIYCGCSALVSVGDENYFVEGELSLFLIQSRVDLMSKSSFDANCCP